MNRILFVVPAIVALTAACQPDQPVRAHAVFPNAPAPTPFTRAYSLSESADGKVRVFAQEDGDATRLMASWLEGREWSEPRPLDFPHRMTLTNPSFSHADGALLFSSDAEIDGLAGRTDLNIWRAPYLGDGEFGPPEPLPVHVINTGANETSAAVTQDGVLYFATNHSRAGGGGYDIMQAVQDESGAWTVTPLPKYINDPRANDHIAVAPDGSWLIFYSHRKPNLGQTDLWRSNRTDDGNWSPPFSLGPDVNTAAIEMGAGLSADGQTLFFSRDGRLMQIALDETPQMPPSE